MPEIKQIEAGKLLCLEHNGSLQKLSDLYAQIMEFVTARRVPIKGDRLSIVYEAPAEFNREQAHFAAAVELSGECAGDGEITVVVQGTAQVACELHSGPPEGLPEVYHRLVSWIKENGYRVTGAPREFYLEGPPGDPAAFLTEIQIPVERAGGGEGSGA